MLFWGSAMALVVSVCRHIWSLLVRHRWIFEAHNLLIRTQSFYTVMACKTGCPRTVKVGLGAILELGVEI